MNKRYLAIGIIIFSIILIGLIIYYTFFYKFSGQNPQVTTPQGNIPQTNLNTPAITNENNQRIINVREPVSKEAISLDELKRISSSFAERFGSFSNQSDYSNIEDLKIFMTGKMQDWADNYINDAIKTKKETAIYYGVTTRSVNQEVKKHDDDEGVAEIIVKTQRREASGTMDNAISYYQDILISFKKERGAWKVDSAEWVSR